MSGDLSDYDKAIVEAAEALIDTWQDHGVIALQPLAQTVQAKREAQRSRCSWCERPAVQAVQWFKGGKDYRCAEHKVTVTAL